MPKVSVIVPSYNLGQYLPLTLKSVLSQTFEDWECLIVDNGSTDNSMHVVADFCASDLRFAPVVLRENQGVAAARNKGLELAEGEYVLFLDADDLIGPNYMADAVRALDEDPSLTVVYGKGERFGAEKTWDLPPFSMGTMLSRNCLYISCFFRRSAVIPGTPSAVLPGLTGNLRIAFDPAFKEGFEDWDFWLSLLESVDEPKVLQLESVCFYYRSRKNSRNRGVTDDALVDIRRLLWEKHRALYSRYFPDPLETVEYKRLESSFRKASKWSLVWKLRLLYRKIFA